MLRVGQLPRTVNTILVLGRSCKSFEELYKNAHIAIKDAILLKMILVLYYKKEKSLGNM